MSCAVLLEQHPPPWRLDKRESTRKCLKYRRGEGEIILVTHEGRGWWDPGSTAKGDVFTLAQRLEPALNFGQVRKLLRPLAGLSPTFPGALAQGQPEGAGRVGRRSVGPTSSAGARLAVLALPGRRTSTAESHPCLGDPSGRAA